MSQIVVEEEASRQDRDCQLQPMQEQTDDGKDEDASGHQQRLSADNERRGQRKHHRDGSD